MFCLNGLSEVWCLLIVSWLFFFFLRNFYSLTVLFGFQEKCTFCLSNTLIKLLCIVIQAYHCWYLNNRNKLPAAGLKSGTHFGGSYAALLTQICTDALQTYNCYGRQNFLLYRWCGCGLSHICNTLCFSSFNGVLGYGPANIRQCASCSPEDE